MTTRSRERRPMDIETLLARAAIEDLRHDFAWFLETSDPDALADLFWEDGVVDTGMMGLMEGQDAIRAGYGQALRGMPKFTALHAVTNPRIRIDGDEAEGTWYLLDHILNEPAVNPLVIVALYEERYRRRDGVWRYSFLKLNYLWSADQGLITADNPMRVPAVVKAAYKANRARAAPAASE